MRTGWRKTWDEPGPDGKADLLHSKWHQPAPGVGPDTLAFFHEMEIVAIGADTAAVEWNFPPAPGYTKKSLWRLHLWPCTTISCGVGVPYIMEILNLDDLAQDQAYEFLFVLGPLLLRGGIGVPINPIAIR